MTYENTLRLKIIILTGLIMVLTCFCATDTFAAELDTYGNLYLNFAYNELNQVYLGSTKLNNLTTGAGGDLFFRGSDDQSLLQFMLDFKYEGNLQDRGSPNLYANQYYFTVPLTEQIFLTGGKKYKKTGVGKFFNVSNRYDRNGSPTNILECDILSSDTFNYGFIGNFTYAPNWEQVQYSAFADFSLNNFNMQNYFYIEGNRGYFIGLDMTYQLEGWQFYCESVFKSKAEQTVVINNDTPDYENSVSDFKVKDLENTTAITVGFLRDAKYYSLTLEYMRNNEGYDLIEQADYINYAGKFTPDDRINLIDHSYLQGRFAKNYLGARYSLPRLLISDLSMTISALASFPDNEINDYLSKELSLNLTYNIVQNFAISFNAVNRSGGIYGEFNRLNEYCSEYQLGLSYSF